MQRPLPVCGPPDILAVLRNDVQFSIAVNPHVYQTSSPSEGKKILSIVNAIRFDIEFDEIVDLDTPTSRA